jgi:thiamine-phosphate pyrophosphorylase
MSNPASRHLDFSDVLLYAVTPASMESGALLEKAAGLLAGGVDALQLRTRDKSDRELMELGKKLRALCGDHGALFIVNDRPDLAVAVGADGVHVGQDDLPVHAVRDMIGHRRLVGVSTHSLPEALAAQRAGADYVGCGPLWATPTKPSAPAVGLGLIGLYHAALKVPFVAIGGIDGSNLGEVIAAGARRVAVVRGLFDSIDPEGAARRFKDQLAVRAEYEPVKE